MTAVGTAAVGAERTRPAPSVVLAVVTYRRPDDLAATLPLLVGQLRVAGPDSEVLVVDNDPGGSAQEVLERSALAGVRYVLEPRPGIAAARNRALAEAGAHDVLVFIDDDERPQEGWLRNLLEVHRSTGCDGVVGPVVSSFGAEPDPWIAAGGFFTRRRLPTGTSVQVAATNNLLLDLHRWRGTGIDFDERFGLSGGSDTLFTRRLTASGARLLWCDEAVVTDVVPPERATRDWVLRRRLRIGNSRSRTEIALATTPAARLAARVRLLGAGAVRIGGGGLRWLWGAVLRDVRRRATGARALASGSGMAGGALGYVYVEYRRPTTRPGPGVR